MVKLLSWVFLGWLSFVSVYGLYTIYVTVPQIYETNNVQMAQLSERIIYNNNLYKKRIKELSENHAKQLAEQILLDNNKFNSYVHQNEIARKAFVQKHIEVTSEVVYMYKKMNEYYLTDWMPKNKCVVKDESKYDY